MPFTIGNKAHKLFPLADKPGRITRITTTPRFEKRINAAELTEFSFLPEGESITIDEARAIEVVNFNHETNRSTQSHFLSVARVGVARGATLRGPLAWRTSDAMEIPDMPKRRVPRLLLLAPAVGCLLPVGLPFQEAYLAGTLQADMEGLVMEHVWWFIGATIFLCLGLANYAHEETLQTLEKDPALEVLSPARRLWA